MKIRLILSLIFLGCPLLTYGFDGFPSFEWPSNVSSIRDERFGDSDCPALSGVFSAVPEMFTSDCNAGKCAILTPGGDPLLEQMYRLVSSSKQTYEPLSGVLQTREDLAEVQQISANEFVVKVRNKNLTHMFVSRFDASRRDFSCSESIISLPQRRYGAFGENSFSGSEYEINQVLFRLNDGSFVRLLYERRKDNLLGFLPMGGQDRLHFLRYPQVK